MDNTIKCLDWNTWLEIVAFTTNSVSKINPDHCRKRAKTRSSCIVNAAALELERVTEETSVDSLVNHRVLVIKSMSVNLGTPRYRDYFREVYLLEGEVSKVTKNTLYLTTPEKGEEKILFNPNVEVIVLNHPNDWKEYCKELFPEIIKK